MLVPTKAAEVVIMGEEGAEIRRATKSYSNSEVSELERGWLW